MVCGTWTSFIGWLLVTPVAIVTQSLFLSAALSFSFGVLAVSVDGVCALELGWDDLFNVSGLISVSVSCCVAVADCVQDFICSGQ